MKLQEPCWLLQGVSTPDDLEHVTVTLTVTAVHVHIAVIGPSHVVLGLGIRERTLAHCLRCVHRQVDTAWLFMLSVLGCFQLGGE